MISLSQDTQLEQPAQAVNPEIQPVDQDRAPVTLQEIVERIEALGYRCPLCEGEMGSRVVAIPYRYGVEIKGYPGRYFIMVPCRGCETRIPLSSLIRMNQEAHR